MKPHIVYYSEIAGTGRFLPNAPILNAQLPRTLQTSDEWIWQRTGIRSRHFAGDTTPLDMAEAASRSALAAANLESSQIDYILAATISADMIFPSLGTLLQHRLGCRSIGAFDLAAACSGFVYGLFVADALVAAGRATHVLLVASEKMSRMINPEDRATFVLFGDGAGAAVISRSERKGVHSVDLYSDGGTTEILRCAPALGTPYIHMNGPAVFKLAVRTMSNSVIATLRNSGLHAEDVDWFIPHQANSRILDAVTVAVGIPKERVVETLSGHGNTSAASIPISLDIAVRDGRIRRGHKVVIAAAGGGFTWGSALIEWG